MRYMNIELTDTYKHFSRSSTYVEGVTSQNGIFIKQLPIKIPILAGLPCTIHIPVCNMYPFIF